VKVDGFLSQTLGLYTSAEGVDLHEHYGEIFKSEN
jgi:hypothetical protein